MIAWAIVLLATGVILSAWTGQWFILGCAVGVVATNVIMIRLARRDRRRHRAEKAAMAMARPSGPPFEVRNPWLEIGTVQRTDAGGYEVWNGKTWVKV